MVNLQHFGPLKAEVPKDTFDLDSVACSTWGWTRWLVLRWNLWGNGWNKCWLMIDLISLLHRLTNRWILILLKLHIEILFPGVQRRLRSKSHLFFLMEILLRCLHVAVWCRSCLALRRLDLWLVRLPDGEKSLIVYDTCHGLWQFVSIYQDWWDTDFGLQPSHGVPGRTVEMTWTFWQDGYKTFDLSLLSKMRCAVTWLKFCGEQIWDDLKFLR